MKINLALIIIFCLGYSCQKITNKSTISNFDSLESQQQWTLVKDTNSSGNLDFTTGENGQAARISYDVTSGGNWVGAKIRIDNLPEDALGVSFKVKCNGASSVWVYLNDSLQNRFEYRLCRSLSEMNETGWQRRFLSFSALPDSVRGDKKAWFDKNALKTLTIVIEPRMDPWYPQLRWFPEPKGQMEFDDVNWVTNYDEPIVFIKNSDEKLPGKKPWERTGICSYPTENDFTGEYSIPSIGFSIFRNDLHWNAVEKTKGVYDFSEYDKMVSIAEAHSARTLLILCYSNELYVKEGLPPVTPMQIDAYCKYCAEAARHFNGRKVDFEIWNEPNYSRFWRPSANAAHFANLMRPAIDSVRKNNAEAKIISGGTAGIDWRFVDSLGVKGALKGLDGIGFHPYRTGSPESFSEDLVCQRWLLKKYFNTEPEEWATEYGASSSWYGNGLQDSTLLMQARIDVRAMLANWIAGFDATMKYNFYAEGDSVDDEQNYGIVWSNLQPRPSYFAHKALRNFTENRHWKGQIKCSNPNAYALQFDGDADRILILWTSAGKLDIDQAGYKTSFILPEKPISVFNFLGKEIPIPEKKYGKWSIEAGGEVVYVVVKK